MTQIGRREAAFPAPLLPFAARVEERIRVLLDAEVNRWRDVDEALTHRSPRCAPSSSRAASGCGPRFATAASSARGGDPARPRVIDAAAALELVHTFALVHDDVMDGSDMRRGARRGAPRASRAHHGGANWRGRAAPLRRGHGDPRRRLRVRLRRPPDARAPPDRARRCSTSCASSCASASRSISSAPRPRAPIPRVAGRIARVQVGQVHRRAAAASRRRARRPARRARGAALGDRLPLGAGVPAARRRARRVRRRRRHGQAGRRRPPRGQADAAASRSRTRGPTDRIATARPARRRPTSTPTRSPRCRTLFVRTGALDEVETRRSSAGRRGPRRARGGADHRRRRRAGSTSSPTTSPGGTASMDRRQPRDRRSRGLEKRYGTDAARRRACRSKSLAARCSGCSDRTARARRRRSRSSRATARPDAGTVRVLGLDPVRDGTQLRPRIGVDAPGRRAVSAACGRSSCCACSRRTTTTPRIPKRCSISSGCATTTAPPVRRLSGGQAQRLSLACALDRPARGRVPRRADRRNGPARARDHVGTRARPARRAA